MAIKPLKRTYNMSDGALLEVNGTVVIAATRDLADLAAYGVVQGTIDDIGQKANAFFSHPHDEYYAGLLMEAVDDRNTKLKAAAEVAEGIVRRGEIVWGKGSSSIKKFGWEGFSKKKEGDKMVTCKTVHKVGTDNLAALGAAGLTQVILDELDDKIGLAIDAIGVKVSRVAERDAGTQERIQFGNTLFEALVTLADTGKHVWEDTDESKYNDYVIYSSGDALQVVTGTAAPLMVIEPSATVNSPNDNITVKNTGTEPLNVYFGDDPTDPVQGPYGTVAGGGETTYKANDIGYTSTMYRLLLFNPHATESVGYEIRVL